MINKNIWMMRFTNDYQTKMVEDLLNYDDICIKLTTTNPSYLLRHKQITDQFFGVSYDNNKINDTSLFEQIKLPFNTPPKNILKYIDSKYIYFSLQILERCCRYPAEISFEEKNFLIHSQLAFWLHNLNLYPPDFVLFIDKPHMYYEILLLGILKNKNIPTFIVAQCHSPLGYFLTNSDFQPILYKKGLILSEVASSRAKLALNNNIPKFDKDIRNEFSTIKYLFLSLRLFIKSIILKLFIPKKKYKMGYYIKRKYMRFGTNTHYDELYQASKYSLNCIFAKFNYQLNCIKKLPKKPYSFLALSADFENTMQPGVSPLNWHLIVKRILDTLPDDHLLFIKEHPVQFVYRYHQQFSRFKGFYKSIKSLDSRVILLPVDMNSLDIIRSSESVFALADCSVFLEAYSLKKKVFPIGPSLINGDTDMTSVTLGSVKEQPYFTKASLYFGSDKEAKYFMKSIIEQIKYHLSSEKV